ncbi:MAG TPA: NAD(P)-dependent oxidoreductase [Planctomycetes bacterium]|nr:NAD(P)-dependent oxidoreductase [Planctomycetota bacterium]
MSTSTLNGRRILISGSSRGIGRAIALRAAREGARIVIAAKTSEPHPKLPGTIHSVAEEVREAGGEALPVVMDIRDDDQVEAAVAAGVEAFGGLDAVINNASAISLSPVSMTAMKRVDLMFDVNVRGTYTLTRAALEALRAGTSPHVLNLSPPLSLDPIWFQHHTAYTISKYGMSLCVLGMAREFKSLGIAVNALWPRTAIATAALAMIPGADPKSCRKPEIVADAACAILARDPATCSGNFFIDDEVLKAEGVEDFDGYAVEPGRPLMPDLFLEGSESFFERMARPSS